MFRFIRDYLDLNFEMMTKVRCIYVVILLMIALSSCVQKYAGRQPDLVETSIKLDEVAGAITNDVVDSLYYVGLSHINGNIPVRIDKIYIINGIIYIADCRRSKIFAYEEASGKPLFLIDRRGGGPEEYIEIRSMTVDDKFVYIVDNATHRLLTFDSSSGEYVGSRRMPIVADDIEVLENDKLLFATTLLQGVKFNVSQPQYRLFVTDGELNILDCFYELIDDEYDPIGQQCIFSRCERGVIFSSAMLDGFTVIDTADPTRHTVVRLPFDKGLEGKTNVDPDELLQYQYLVTVPFMCGDNLYLQYSSGSGHVEQHVWNKESNGILNNSEKNLSKAILPIIGSASGCFISMIDCDETYIAITDGGFTRAPENVEQLLRNDDGIALVFYKMK